MERVIVESSGGHRHARVAPDTACDAEVKVFRGIDESNGIVAVCGHIAVRPGIGDGKRAVKVDVDRRLADGQDILHRFRHIEHSAADNIVIEPLRLILVADIAPHTRTASRNIEEVFGISVRICCFVESEQRFKVVCPARYGNVENDGKAVLC